MPSIKLNAAANFCGAGYVALASLLVLPLLLNLLGSVEFGLIAFAMVVHAFSQLLDLGMSPLIAREAARSRSGIVETQLFVKLLRSLEVFTWILAASIACAIHLCSDFLVDSWLELKGDGSPVYVLCMSLMGVAAGLRLPSSLYKSTLKGLEKQSILNVVVVLVGTIRFPGALLAVYVFESGVAPYFAVQVLASLIELLALIACVYRSVPQCRLTALGVYWAEIKPMATFSLGVAYAVFVWVLLTQVDKLMLSKLLPVDDFGFFVIASALSGGVFLLAAPITDATLPRLTLLFADDRIDEMQRMYLRTTAYVACLAFSFASVLAVFAHQIAVLWVKNGDAEMLISQVLPFLSYGSSVAVVAGMIYQLQVAHGSLRLHSIYNTVLVLLQVPLLYVATMRYGALGAAGVWCAVRIATMAFWTPVVHRIHANGIHPRWFLCCVLTPLLVSAVLTRILSTVSVRFYGGSTIGDLSLIAVSAAVTLIFTTLTCLQLLQWFGPSANTHQLPSGSAS